MADTRNKNRPLSNEEKYLPFLYPVLMPLLTLNSFKIPVSSAQEALSYWLFTGFIQFILVCVIRKMVYTTTYYPIVRWLIAAFVCVSIIVIYVFLEYNYLHFTKAFANPNPWINVSRYSINIPILIALVESIKAFQERSTFNTNNIQLQSENTKAQFNLLLQQVNPHFLFNSLTTLQAMVRAKDTHTEEFIIKLKEVFQQTLKKEKGTVTLKEELEFFNAYMYLITLRQGSSVMLDVSIANQSLSYQIPTYTLQLLAENCIKHNIASEANPLMILVYQKDPKSVTVANNYQPKKRKVESFGIGISNLKQRYALAGIEDGVLITQDENIYETTVKLM
ncbi:MAG: histidine kinase [Chitinophagales bacterium]|nr:histidine kinase [Chitinophagales bacterium]